jgi:hypothetical protein
MKQVLRRPFPPILPEKAGQSVKDCPAFVRLSGRKIIGAKLLCTAKAEVFAGDEAENAGILAAFRV